MKKKLKFKFLNLLVIIFTIINLFLLSTLINNKINSHLSFYISTTGKDSNNGKRSSPFKTLKGCQNAIRTLIKENKLDKGIITIYLKEGTYYLNESFVLDNNDFISNNVSVIYKPYKKDKIIITGAVELKISEFKKITDKNLLSNFNNKEASKNILQYDLKKDGIYFGSTLEDITKAPEVFFNDKPMTLSRWPNDSFLTLDKVIYNPQQNEKKGFIFQDNEDHISTLKYLNDIWMFGYWRYDWSDYTVKVKSIDTINSTIESDSNATYGISDNQRYYFFNILQEVDTPGEYYIDREKGILYFYPPISMENAKIQLSQLNEAFIKITDLSNITFQGIIFEGSRGSGIVVSNSNNIKIDNCIFRNISQNAVTIDGGKICGVDNSTIYNMGTGGIVINGGDRNTLTAAGHYCYNNEIFNYARLKRTYSAAIQLSGVGSRISNNSIHDSQHTAIQFSGNDHVIEYNEIYKVATETDDVGAIYTGRDWTYRGNIIRYNFLHDIENPIGSVGKAGIYLDDCMSSAEVFGNLFYKVDIPLFIGGGRDITVSNNIIVDCNNSIYFDERGITRMELLNQLYVNLNKVPFNSELWQKKYPQLNEMTREYNPGIPKGNIIENNVLYKTSETKIARSVIENGIERNNVWFYENPGITDIDKMDFSLKRNAQVFEKIKDFKDIPFYKIGVNKSK